MASFQAATNSAPVKWAQRKDSIYLTIALRDVKNEQVSLTDKTLKFSGDSDGKHWAIELEFLKDVDAEGSIFKVNPASVHFNIKKKNQDEEFWSRLLMDKAKEKNNVSADWSRWVDEDEGPEDFNMDGLDGGMGMGGMGG
jgi:prostaglandin-E synthase